MNKILKTILIIVIIIVVCVGIIFIPYFIDKGSIITSSEYNVEGTNIVVEVRNDETIKLSENNPLTISNNTGSVIFSIEEMETSTFMMKLMLSDEMQEFVTIDKLVKERGMTYMICHMVGDDGTTVYFCYGTIEETDKGFACEPIENKDFLVDIMNNITFSMNSISRDFKLWVIEQFETKL